MVSRINDSRIGIRNNINGRIVQFPSRYADGGYWNRQNNPAPTTVYFGPGMKFFYTLPVGKARIDTLTRQELERIVMSSLTDEDIAELTAPREIVKKEQTGQAVQSEPLVVQNDNFQFSIGQPLPGAMNTGTGGVVINDDEPQAQAEVEEEQPMPARVSNSLFEGILPSMEDTE